MYTINYIHKIININYKTILFLHGWGCDKSYFRQTTEIIDYANTIVIDLPGFGENEALKKPYEIEDYVNEINNFLSLNNLHLDIIVGHSFGGKLAVFLAEKTKVNYLVLLSPSIINKDKTILTYIKIFLYKIIKRINFFNCISQKMGSEDYKYLSPVMKKTMSNIINKNGLKQFKKLSIETLIIYGKNDTITPPYLGKRLLKANKKAHLIMLDGNHFFYLSNIKIINKIIKELVENE